MVDLGLDADEISEATGIEREQVAAVLGRRR
jgi:hypothetical protein